MDVSEVTREATRAVAATVMATTRSNAPAPAPDTSDDTGAALTDRWRRAIDPSEALAERARSGLDRPSVMAPPTPESELWIPAWVRAQYNARARRGWFLPPPSALMAYVDEDDPGDPAED